MTITRPAARLFLQESAIQQGDRLKEAEAQVSGGWGGGGALGCHRLHCELFE